MAQRNKITGAKGLHFNRTTSRGFEYLCIYYFVILEFCVEIKINNNQIPSTMAYSHFKMSLKHNNLENLKGSENFPYSLYINSLFWHFGSFHRIY